MEAIFSKKRKQLSDNYSQSLRDLVDKCLDIDPDIRPTIEQLLRNPLFKSELSNILNEFLPLTYEYATALTTHLLLE